MKIDDFLTDDGELHEVVRNALPSQYLDDLTEEVRETYSTALDHRDEDDFESLARSQRLPQLLDGVARILAGHVVHPTVYRELTGDYPRTVRTPWNLL